MSNTNQTNKRIFATGAFVEAFEIELHGIKQWRWIMTGQEAETFSNGKEIEVHDYATTFEELFVKQVKD
jgi:hypothetical protein